MKILLFSQLLCLLSLSITAQSVDTFYIDKSGYGNYTSINNAVNALKTTTLYKPRVYIIKAGTYTENISIPQINGSSASNYVVFHGENKNTVIVSSTSGNTIEIKGADHITFENMMVEGFGNTCFRIYNNSDYVTIEGCNIIGDTTASTGYEQPINASPEPSDNFSNDAITITNNSIKGGYSGIWISGIDTLKLSNNNIITNNNISKFYRYGIYHINCYNSILSNNQFDTARNTSDYYSILSNNSSKTLIANNTLFQGDRAIYLNFENERNSSSDTSWVINNFIYPIMNSKNDANGICTNLSSKIIILHNSVWVNYSGILGFARHSACRLFSSTDISLYNNLFKSSGNAPSMGIFYSSNIKSDYNNFCYSNPAGNAFFIDNATKTFNQFKATSFGYAHDAHSYNNTNPHFKSSTDLHLDSTYYPLYGIDKGVTADIDGDPRCPYKTTIGADESRYPLQKPKTGFNILGNICVLATVQLKNTTTGVTPMGYQWFINGSPVAKTINYNYYVSAPTVDTITLIADNCGGHDTFTKILNVSGPVADFTVASQTPIVNHDTVEFLNLTDCSPNLTKWEIQPSAFNIISSYPNGSNPKIVFTDTGCYDVKLIVARGSFYDTLIRTCYIKAIDSVYIVLNGVNPHFMEACHGYKDAGASCYAFSGNPPPLHYDSSYQTFIDTGLYKRLFWAINPSTGDTIKTIRAVHVKPDLTKPIITLMGNNPDTIEAIIPYNDPGFISSDSCGILTDGVSGIVDENQVGKYILRYFATDNNGNTDTIERIVFVVDITPPNLALIEDTVVVEVYNAYEIKVIINDNYCSENEMTVHSMGNIDTSKLGFYFNTIWVEDCNGNFSDTATQVVWIVDRTSPVLKWTGPDTIFLKVWEYIAANFDDSLTITDNYDQINKPLDLRGTYYADYLPRPHEGCFNIIFSTEDQSANKSNEIVVWVCFEPSSIEENNNGFVKVFPNPNNGHFNVIISNLNSNDVFISLINSLGGILFKEYQRVENDELTLHFSNIPTGFYLLEIRNDNGLILQKIIIH